MRVVVFWQQRHKKIKTGFSLLKLKEDNQNVNAGGLAIECCRQFEALFPHVTYFLPMVDSSDLKVAGFLLVAGT